MLRRVMLAATLWAVGPAGVEVVAKLGREAERRAKVTMVEVDIITVLTHPVVVGGVGRGLAREAVTIRVALVALDSHRILPGRLERMPVVVAAVSLSMEMEVRPVLAAVALEARDLAVVWLELQTQEVVEAVVAKVLEVQPVEAGSSFFLLLIPYTQDHTAAPLASRKTAGIRS